MEKTMYYIPADKARETLLNRASLKSQVESYWRKQGILFPEIPDVPLGIFGRPAQFRVEDAAFTLLAENAGLEPLWLTYNEDIFTSRSSVKMSFVRPRLFTRLDKSFQPITERKLLTTSVGESENLKISDLKTSEGESLVDYHYNRLQLALPNARLADMSSWAKAWGGRSQDYYFAYLSLFVAHGVLFEDYHGGESGAKLSPFTINVFEPAFAKVSRVFGSAPLLVKMPWKDTYSMHPCGSFLTDWRATLSAYI